MLFPVKEFFSQIDSTVKKVQIRLPTYEGEPIEKLSKFAPIYKDKIYLFADFDNVATRDERVNLNRTKFIPVYLINNRNKKYSFTGYEMENLQQVYRKNDTSWVRTQRGIPMWCGTSYDWIAIIKPKEFYKVLKYFSDEGDDQIVRYTFFNTDVVISNAGFAKVNMEKVEKAKYDRIALQISSPKFLIEII
ncbi:MAG: hypothetical protein JSW63_03235 [Ignavibacterium sp.]|nr:MAG: hypothetical protein JSW63_03235 [Ignavibacterium sp.]